MTAIAERIGRRDTAVARASTDIILIIIGSFVVAALAQVAVGEVVPFSGQTLGVLLVAGALGGKRAAASMLLYLAEGAAGLPVFAQGKSGLAYITTMDPLHVTGGYLWGFVVAAFLIGWLCEHGWDKNFGSSIGAMFLGEVVIFALGIWWLQRALGLPLADALNAGLYPFVVWDAVKIVAAAAALPAAWRLMPKE